MASDPIHWSDLSGTGRRLYIEWSHALHKEWPHLVKDPIPCLMYIGPPNEQSATPCRTFTYEELVAAKPDATVQDITSKLAAYFPYKGKRGTAWEAVCDMDTERNVAFFVHVRHQCYAFFIVQRNEI